MSEKRDIPNYMSDNEYVKENWIKFKSTSSFFDVAGQRLVSAFSAFLILSRDLFKRLRNSPLSGDMISIMERKERCGLCVTARSRFINLESVSGVTGIILRSRDSE